MEREQGRLNAFALLAVRFRFYYSVAPVRMHLSPVAAQVAADELAIRQVVEGPLSLSPPLPPPATIPRVCVVSLMDKPPVVSVRKVKWYYCWNNTRRPEVHGGVYSCALRLRASGFILTSKEFMGGGKYMVPERCAPACEI